MVVWSKKIGQILYADKILKNWVPNSLFECVYFQGVFILTILFASQLTLGFFGVTFHLRAQEDLRQELVLRLQKNYNVLGGEYFSPALDYIQTTVIKGKLFKEPRHKKLNLRLHEWWKLLPSGQYKLSLIFMRDNSDILCWDYSQKSSFTLISFLGIWIEIFWWNS